MFAEGVLGVSKNKVCPGESVDFWDDFSELNQQNEIFDFTIDFGDGIKESKSQTHCYFQQLYKWHRQLPEQLLVMELQILQCKDQFLFWK